jgi:hypothetical protein
MIRAVATWLCRWAPPGRPWQLHLVLLLARRAAAAGTDVASLDAAELRRFLIDIGTDRQWNWPVAMTARSYYGGFFRHLERPDVVDQVGALPSTLCGGRIHETDLQRAVVAAIDSGASPTAAAKAYGVSRSAACRFYLQTTGELASVAHERHKQARRRELVARYDAGEPLEALADWWACSIGHVITVLRTEGRRPSRNG